MLTVRTMAPDDIPIGLRLCRQAGWNQVQADWRRLLDLEPEGCFMAETGGKCVGTATAIRHGQACGWIGMVLVDPDHRRRGIGTVLLERCIDYLQSRSIAAIKLDASAEGREVYLRLGFADEYEIRRSIASPPREFDAQRGPSIRPVRESDWSRIADLDGSAFGADRIRFLRRLASDHPETARVACDANRVVGFGLGYLGHDAYHAGPIVALDADAAAALLDALLSLNPSRVVHLDVLANNAPAMHLASQRGFTVQRRLTRMVLGRNETPGAPSLVYAASGFETG